MARFTPATRAWFVALAVGATALGALLARVPDPVGPRDWAALALFGLCAAVAHRFPIKSGAESSYRLTNVFLAAGVIALPLALLAPLVLLALGPDTLLSTRRGGFLVRLLVNAPPTVLATGAAGLWLADVGREATPHGLAGALAFVVAGALATLLQNLLLGVGMAINFRLPLWRVDPLSPVALQGDLLFALVGVAIAAAWAADPAMLLLLLPLLGLAHRLTSTAHLARLAQLDAKTGLHNARHFEQALAEEVARGQRLGRPLAVLFADLDRFKAVNDTRGHDAGDRVLRAFGALLVGNLRAGDVVARFGGEEFVALLPQTDADEAYYLAERLRATVERHPFPLPDGAPARCTVSVGVAAYPEDGATVEALLKQADAAMYRAKGTRNAVARPARLPSVPRLPREGAAGAAPAPRAPAAAAPRRRAAVLLWGTVALGALALALSLPMLATVPDWRPPAVLLVLSVAAEFVTVQVFEDERQALSLSFGAVAALAAVTAVPAGAPLLAAIAAGVHVLRRRQWRRGAGRVLFNLANPTLAAGIAAGAAALLRPLVGGGPWATLLLAAVAAALHYTANTGAIALNMAAHAGRPVRAVVAEVRWAAPATVLLGLTGAFLGSQHAALGAAGMLVLALPLAVLGFTLRFAARKSRQAIAALRQAKAEAEGAHAEKEQTLRQLIDVVAAIIDARDQAVAGHSGRVAAYAVALGEELRLGERELAYLHTAGLLHDLGKIGVPEAILHKPARLTPEEYAIVQGHAALGERILAAVRPLAEVARMVGDHHERYDGAGYPHAEAGEAITRGGRILAVADTLDSILSDRPYAEGKPLAWALAELDRCAGAHFDPEVVAALHRVVAARGPAFVAPDRSGPLGASPPTRPTGSPHPASPDGPAPGSHHPPPPPGGGREGATPPCQAPPRPGPSAAAAATGGRPALG